VRRSASAQQPKECGAFAVVSRAGLNAVDYSTDGSLVATAGLDGTVRLFDGQTGSQRLVLRGSGCSVDDVAFSPDGNTPASTTCGGVRIWALDIDDLLEIARQNVTRTLPDEECQQYLHLDRCPWPRARSTPAADAVNGSSSGSLFATSGMPESRTPRVSTRLWLRPRIARASRRELLRNQVVRQGSEPARGS
jgi:WD40 repeat protein